MDTDKLQQKINIQSYILQHISIWICERGSHNHFWDIDFYLRYTKLNITKTININVTYLLFWGLPLMHRRIVFLLAPRPHFLAPRWHRNDETENYLAQNWVDPRLASQSKSSLLLQTLHPSESKWFSLLFLLLQLHTQSKQLIKLSCFTVKNDW